jgi:Uma2 family endonuclease
MKYELKPNSNHGYRGFGSACRTPRARCKLSLNMEQIELADRDVAFTELSVVKLPLPLRFRPDRRWSDEELLAFCAANEPMQVERESDGTIVMMTPAGYKGNRREIYAGREMDLWAEKDGRGEAFGDNAGFSLDDGSVRSPDAGWISLARLHGVSSAQQEKFLPRCPEFVVEVLSASDSLSETEVKMEKWIANGAELGWLIDPFAADGDGLSRGPRAGADGPPGSDARRRLRRRIRVEDGAALGVKATA